MKLNWNFLGGVGVQNKKPSVGGVWIFSGTTQYTKLTEFNASSSNEDPNSLDKILGGGRGVLPGSSNPDSLSDLRGGGKRRLIFEISICQTSG